MHKNHRILQTANIIGFLAMVTVNALANILPIAGKQTGELSAQYPNLFVPAGFTFSIWGVIYLLLLAFTVYQARDLFSSAQKSITLHKKIGWGFFLTCIFNAVWIFAWHYEQVFLSVVIMLLLLISLIVIYLRLNIGQSSSSLWEKLLVHIPFSVYLGWISVATVANITAFLVHIGWQRFGLSEMFWLITMLTVCVIITLIMLLRRKDAFFTLVVIWAFIGILANHLG